MKRTLVSVLAIVGVLSSALVAIALVASPASAVATPGSSTQAITRVNFVVSAPTAGSVPSLQLAFSANNTQRCTPITPLRFFANGTSASRNFITNYDPTPTNVANNDEVTCLYTVTINSNLSDCSFTINRGEGITDQTGTSFTLEGTDSPNFSSRVGAFSDLTAARVVTITPADCSHPAAVTTQQLVQIRNLESTERYRATYTPFGNCSTRNNPLEVIERSGWSFAVLDLRCNWRLDVAPVDNVATSGCRVDAILYFADGTHAVDSDGELFIHQAGSFAAVGGKLINRIDLSFSNTSAESGVCEQEIRLTANVQLATAADRSLFGGEQVTFTVEPLDNRQSAACTQRTEFKGSALNPATLDIVQVPRGATTTCAYKITAAATSTALQLAGNQPSVREFDTRGAARINVDFRYTQRRIPVRVALQVFAPRGSIFRTDQTIDLHVTVPGPCGSDTSLFGGVSASVGVQYGMFIVPGLTYAIGPNARSVNPAASYSLPPYVFVNNQRVSCTVRATELSAFERCTIRNAQRDSSGRAFVETTWAANTNLITVALQYDCTSYGTDGGTGSDGDTSTTPDTAPDPTPGAGSSFLSQGWITLPFNGITGTTPQAFARELDNAIAALWVWNAQTQSWRGWAAGQGSLGLTSLTRGDIVMAYVPSASRVTYNPATLLNTPAATGRLTIPPGYSFQVFGGAASRSLESLLGPQSDLIPVVYRWDSQAQAWNYFLPGRQQLPSVSVPWFDVISPEDAVFIFNASSVAITIPWS